MDLDTIIFHLDNFVTTWEGWGKVAKGVADLFDITGNIAKIIKTVA